MRSSKSLEVDDDDDGSHGQGTLGAEQDEDIKG